MQGLSHSTNSWDDFGLGRHNINIIPSAVRDYSISTVEQITQLTHICSISSKYYRPLFPDAAKEHGRQFRYKRDNNPTDHQAN